MAEVADRNILTDIQLKIAASRSQNDCTFNRRRPDNVAVNDPLDVFEHGISMIAGLGERRVLIGSEQNRVGPIDAYQAQLAQCVGHRIGIIAHIGWKRVDWIAGAFSNALDICFGVSVEDGPVFGKGKFLRRVFRRLPIGVIRSALHVIDCLTG